MNRGLSKLFLTAISILFLAIGAQAQSIALQQDNDDRHWSELMKDESVNFFEVQAAFNEYWEGREVTKGSGFKQFKRWEWFMEPRVYPSGERFAPDAVYKEIQKNKSSNANKSQLPGVWTYFGNTDIPDGGGAGRISMVRSDPNNTSTYFACAPAGGLWKSTNEGGSWTVMNTDDLGSIGVSDVAIDPNDSNTIYLGTGDGDAGDTYALGVLKSIDGGSTWNTTGLNWTVQQTRRVNRILIHPNNSNILLAATTNGLYKTSDAGANWSQTQSGNFKDLKFKPGDPSTVYIVGNTDEFYRSTDNGDSFTNIVSGLPTSGVSRFALGVSIANPAYVYILVGASNQGFYGMYRSTDSGATWTQQSTSPNILGWDVNGGDSGGQAWYDLTMEVDPTDADVLYTGGVNTWKSTDGGVSWNIVGHWYGAGGNPYVHADVHGMYFIPGTTTLLVACDGGVFRSTDNGNSFSDLSSNLEVAQQYRLGLNATDQNQLITGWQDNGTNLKTGANWAEVVGGDGFECIIDYNDPNNMYGALYYGNIRKSTTGGGGFSTIVGSGGAGVNQNGAWLTPYIMSPNDPNTLYVGKSTVYKSTDGGNNWSTLSGLSGSDCNALAVAPSDENYIYASKSGNFYRSTDGTNFTSVGGTSGSYISYIAVDPLDAQKVWITYSGFGGGAKVYFSSDAGDTWTDYSTGLPNIPANCIAYHTGTNDGLYVGTDAGVYYRDAISPSWQPYTDGLPNVPVSELEIHYASNTIVCSTYGRGVWHAPLFTLPADDAGIININSPDGTLCETSFIPEITIGNFGENDLTSVTIDYGIQGGTVYSYTWTGTMVTGASQIISLPAMDEGTGAFTFDALITNVNGVAGDDNILNDDSSNDFYVTGGTNYSTFTLVTDCWAVETSWDVTDAMGNIVFSGAGYTNYSTNDIDLCLADGCYTLTVYDSYGDGLTGADFGGCSSNGDFYLIDDLGNVLAQMTQAAFGFDEAHDFCVPFVTTPGCMNTFADNYNSLATVDDGSCVFSCNLLDLYITTDCWGNETTWDIQDDLGNVIASGPSSSYGNQQPFVETICIPDGCFDLNIYDSFGDGMQGGGCSTTGDYYLEDMYGTVLVQMPTPAFGNQATHNFCVPVGVPGCMNSTACNYDSMANVDDGSCTYPGCIDSTACNYDNTAGCDDGSCEYLSCLGCSDNTACNYDSTATQDDGSCTYPGCNDSTACNYNNTAGCDDGSCTYPGCTDNLACNYDNSAACDDGSCEYLTCAGCTNSTACNYDNTATIDDGSCTFPGCTDGAACNYNSIAGCDNGTCTFPGCTDSTASNYNATAGCDDGSCTYPGCIDNTACNFDSTANMDDGSCTYPGCNDSTACNYDNTAGCDDGSCTYPGCTDNLACNYNMTAACDDGSCTFPGCNDNTACNFEPLAGCDDGSCTFPGCNDSMACNYDNTAGCDDGSCTYPGCNDSTACNYDNTAGCDDGSCTYPGCNVMGACNYDSTAGCYDGSCTFPGCTDSMADNYNTTAGCDDGSCVYIGCDDTTACNYDPQSNFNDGSCTYPGCIDTTADNYNALAGCDDGSCQYSGCTDLTACNYNMGANIDDGSCTYPGCIDSTACNYDSTAGCSDGSCTYAPCTCAGDYNNDGFVNAADLLMLLAEFGCTSSCQTDLSGDDTVNAADLLLFLAAFGTSCQ